ncbi:hypothetical protein SAMN05216326_10864 [Nitrosomonas marina]|uniref:Uncharacterized protein n=1 Tax=Nitrosomonas marina TaxID=917 RepID=A0A1I0ATN4_9PROT|nr:hypothetical protein [Nitrosomonas marina]SES97712.1 hypothetical protein SAMN05216326_10864 [Nitrosomonas marina]
MIRFIFTTAFLLVIALLSYNYFFGTEEEKKQAQEIFTKGTEVVGAGADLLKSEYQKYQDGKYDQALDNISHLLSTLREQGDELLEEIDNWNQKKDEWDQKKYELQQLIDANPDVMDKESITKTIAELEKERKVLETEGRRLKEQAE